MVHFREKDRYDYGDLLEIIRILRSPEGCPWDQVQTHASIRRGFWRRPMRPPRPLTGTTPLFCRRSWGTC